MEARVYVFPHKPNEPRKKMSNPKAKITQRCFKAPTDVWEAFDAQAAKHFRSPTKHLEYLLSILLNLNEPKAAELEGQLIQLREREEQEQKRA